MRTANLLPWRRRQKRDCLRFWAVLFSGTLLLLLMLWSTGRASDPLLVRAATLRHASDRVLHQALEKRQKQWRAFEAQRQQQQRWAQQKAKTMAWKPVLTALAAAIPEQTWLAHLRYQQSTLSLSGYALTLPALSALEAALRQLPGFTLGAPGEMRKDAQGRWQFSWTLTRKENADADPS